MKNILRQYHVILLIFYLSIITLLASWFTSPDFRDSNVFIVGIIPTVFLILFLFRSKSLKAKMNFEDPKLEKFFRYYDIAIIALTSLCFISIAYAISKNLGLFTDSFSYSLRLISTALHPLYPLESRLFHTLIPFSLVAPFGSKSIKKTLWVMYILLIFCLQTKIAPIYLFLIISLKLFFYEEIPLKKKMTIGSISLIGCLILFGFTYKFSARDFDRLMKNDQLKQAMSTQISESKPFTDFPKQCVQKEDPTLSVASSYYSFNKFSSDFFYRLILLPAIVSRIYVCAWDNGFKGYFQGHQIARIFKAYVPVYNIIYTSYFPNHAGFSHGHAVGNFVFDSYFQLGFVGTLFCILAVLLLLVLIDALPETESFRGLKHLMKLNFLYGSLTASLLSTFLFFIPLLGLIIYLLLNRDSKQA